ncbi:toxin-antitoxin system YwqK family antitoxin [Pontibacter arcticus]|nr:hypothetical protein [Pontibacter arcticus]
MHQGKREGLTTSYYENGNLQGKILYRNDEENGRATYYHQNGNVMQEVDFVDGQIHGFLIEYSEDNIEKILTSFRDGVPHGKFVKFFPSSGKPAMEGIHEEGKMVGTLSYYDREGRKLRECYFDKNEISTSCKDL